MAAGKKVLFVAEKLAALNVVRSQLEAVGLGEFLLPLQAERSTREQVIDSICELVDMDQTRTRLLGLDLEVERFARLGAQTFGILRDQIIEGVPVLTFEAEEEPPSPH